MGYGIGTDHVDISVATSDRTSFGQFVAGLGDALGALLKAGCSEFKIQVHENGAVVTGNKPVAPEKVTDEDKAKPLKEMVGP